MAGQHAALVGASEGLDLLERQWCRALAAETGAHGTAASSGKPYFGQAGPENPGGDEIWLAVFSRSQGFDMVHHLKRQMPVNLAVLTGCSGHAPRA